MSETKSRPYKPPPRWFMHAFWRVHRALYRLSGGRFLWTPASKRGWGAMHLTTIGRKSGKQRGVIVGYLEEGPNLVVLAMNGGEEGHPAWWLNLEKHPGAVVRLSRQEPRPVRARAATGEERDRLWQRWVSVDPDNEAAARRSTETPVVVFEPREAVTPATGFEHRANDMNAAAVATQRSTMRAIVQRCYGPADVLEQADVDTPVAGDRDILVRVCAASVHPGDYYLLTGVPYLMRLAFGLLRPRNAIRGRDLAGVVEAVGKDVTGLQSGDEVFGWSTTGTLAEYVCAPADHFVPKPANLTMEQAAAVPMSGFAALQALHDVADVQPGQSVLVTGASGGVGTFAVQIAKALGAEVTGVCSPRNADLVRSLGAEVIDYTRTDFTRTGRRYDVILDNVEAQPLSATRRALTPSGTLIPNNGRGGRWVGPLRRIITARLLSLFTRQTLRPFYSLEKREDLLALAELIEAGQLTPVIDRTYPLSRAAEALRYLGAGHTRGKVVVTLPGPTTKSPAHPHG